jgi:hypothetical protein
MADEPSYRPLVARCRRIPLVGPNRSDQAFNRGKRSGELVNGKRGVIRHRFH